MSKELNEKLIKIIEQQGEIKASLAAVEVNLREHMRRTDNVEGRTETLFELHSKNKAKIDMALGAIGLVSFLGLCLTIYVNFLKIFP